MGDKSTNEKNQVLIIHNKVEIPDGKIAGLYYWKLG